MLIGFISTCLVLSIFCYCLYRFNFFQLLNISKNYIYLAFGLKLIAAIFIYLIYTFYYTDRSNADVFKFFDDAEQIHLATQGDISSKINCFINNTADLKTREILNETSFWDSSDEVFFNDNRTLIRIHLLLLLFSQGFYFFHLLFFVLLSIIGSVGLFKFFSSNSEVPKSIIFLATFLLPSVLLWTSAPLKESFLLFSLGLFLYSLNRMQSKIKVLTLISLILGIVCLISLKIHILFCLFPSLMFFLISKSYSSKNLLIKFSATHLLSLVLVLIFSSKILEILLTKQQQFFTLLTETKANSAIDLYQFSNFIEIIQTIPQALYNVLFHPILPTNWGPFTLLASLEHVFYIGFLILPFIFLKKQNNLRLMLFCASFVLIAFTLIGLTIPILGAIVRYKAPLLPFYIIAISTFVDFSKISSKIK